jgi:hypothetical protein
MQAECISHTVDFFPKQDPTLQITSTDAAIMAAEVLIKALNNPTVLLNVNALCGTAQTALEELS